MITLETEKKRKYDMLANHSCQLYKMKTKILPWVMACGGIVLQKVYIKES